MCVWLCVLSKIIDGRYASVPGCRARVSCVVVQLYDIRSTVMTGKYKEIMQFAGLLSASYMYI